MTLFPDPDFPDNPSRADLEKLSRLAGVPLEKLVALSSERDPFLAGTPMHERDAARFMALVEFLHETTGENPEMGLRDLHYALLNTNAPYMASEWQWLLSASGSARDLNLIEPWAFPDERTQALLDSRRGEGFEIEYAITKPMFFVPTEAQVTEVEAKGFSSLLAQPVRVLACMEKDSEGLRGEVLGPCYAAGVELRVTIGFSPETLAARLVREALSDKRPLVVFLITDADSAGEHMAVVTARHLEHLAKHYDMRSIFVDRIALTLDQVQGIEKNIGKPIPLAPDVARDIGRVELNALPIFAPGWLRGQVEQALESVTVEIEEPEVDVPEWLEEHLDKAKRIAGRVYEGVEGRLRYIEASADDAIDGWEPEVPEIEVPEVDFDRDWILDTDRDYLTQLNAYRRHGAAHRDPEPLVLTERLCACGCGESLAHMAVQARYLNGAHRHQHRRRT